MKRPEELHLSLHDRHFDNQPMNLPLDVLLGKTPKMTRDVQTLKAKGDALVREGIHHCRRGETRTASADRGGEGSRRDHR
ncbi:hypothetical protein ACLK19_17035 [Escherichia coli]